MTVEIDKITGLPKELFDLQEITKEGEKIKVRIIKRAFGKVVTVVSGFDNEEEAKELGKLLKKQLACGGTIKGKVIELQGEHAKKVKATLIKHGYKEAQIDA